VSTVEVILAGLVVAWIFIASSIVWITTIAVVVMVMVMLWRILDDTHRP
jgi:hypothetical protein